MLRSRAPRAAQTLSPFHRYFLPFEGVPERRPAARSAAPPRTPSRCPQRSAKRSAALSALRRVQFDEVLELRGVASDWAALVSLHIIIHTTVAKHKAGRGQGCGVDSGFAAQRAHCLQFG